MAKTDDRHVTRYMERLRRAASDLPASVRNELLDNVKAHLEETTAGADEAGVRTALEELGTPEEIAASARANTSSRTPGQCFYDRATAFVLVAGGFVVPILGWIVGVVMLWSGPRWNTAQKILGTAAWPVAVIAATGALLVRFPSTAIPGSVIFLVGMAPLVIGLPTVLIYLLLAAARSRA